MRASVRTWYALILFGFGVAGLLVCKPRIMFREDGSMYEFGTGHDRSVFTFGTAVTALAIVCGFLFAWVDMVVASARPPAPAQAPVRPVAADPFDLRNGF
jgi:hypothetical protein